MATKEYIVRQPFTRDLNFVPGVGPNGKPLRPKQTIVMPSGDPNEPNVIEADDSESWVRRLLEIGSIEPFVPAKARKVGKAEDDKNTGAAGAQKKSETGKSDTAPVGGKESGKGAS